MASFGRTMPTTKEWFENKTIEVLESALNAMRQDFTRAVAKQRCRREKYRTRVLELEEDVRELESIIKHLKKENTRLSMLSKVSKLAWRKHIEKFHGRKVRPSNI